jgi:hypothetical protein
MGAICIINNLYRRQRLVAFHNEIKLHRERDFSFYYTSIKQRQ